MFPIYAEPDARLPIAASSIFQGPDVTLSHADGFQTKENSIARLARRLNFSGINSGEDFYKRFCDPESATAPNKSDAFATAPITRTRQYQIPQSATLKGYPKPLVADKKFNTTSGYYLKGSGYNNVAVLALSAFGAPDARGNYFSYLTNFQQTVEAFLKSSKTAGKKRLVIDLTANSGGLVVAAYELFAQVSK